MKFYQSDLFFKAFKISLGWAVLLLFGCDDNKSITPYIEPLYSLEWNLNQDDDYLSKINFLFIIDTSGSMDKFNETLANNAERFLQPIFNKYPYYDYNFAITQMVEETRFIKQNYSSLFFNSDFLLNCQLSEDLEKQSVLGSYISYRKGFSSKSSIKNILCFLGQSIQNIEPRIASTESYFQHLSYILKETDKAFQDDFFASDSFLVLFFISDNWRGVDYERLLKDPQNKNPHIMLANKKISELKKQMINIKNVKTYGVVLDYERSDRCGGELGGQKPNQYPFHFYEFVRQTEGLIVSLCDSNWGQQLEEVYKDFFSAFPDSSFVLDKVPQLDSIEVFLNGIEVPNDVHSGWTLNLEKLSIDLGPNLNLSYYQKNKKEAEDNKLLVRYHPLNLELLR